MRFHALENCPSIQDIESQFTLQWVIDTNNNTIEVVQPIYRTKIKDPDQPLKLTFKKERKVIYQQKLDSISDPCQNYQELSQQLKLYFSPMLTNVEPVFLSDPQLTPYQKELIYKYQEELF